MKLNIEIEISEEAYQKLNEIMLECPNVYAGISLEKELASYLEQIIVSGEMEEILYDV